MGVGLLDPSSGIDVWLRVVHVVRSARPDVSLRWLLPADGPAETAYDDAIAHERWHLGLDDGIEFVAPQDQGALAAASGQPTVVIVTARPAVHGASGGEATWRGALAFANAANAGVVGFGGGAVPPPEQRVGVDLELIDYPDADALADAAVRALSGAAAGLTQPSGRRPRARSSLRR